jgi:PAS domain S-box-containing protein
MPDLPTREPTTPAGLTFEQARQARGPFVVAAETTRMAMLFTDACAVGNPIIFANDAFLTLTGYARGEVLHQPFKFLMARADSQTAGDQIDAAFRGECGGHFEMRDRRKDGSLFWAAVFTHPTQDAKGAILNHFISFIDLTDHEREAEHLRFLLDELNHRTQNTLATVQALAVQTLRGVVDKEVIATFERRILALAKGHGLLGQSNWDAVTVRDVLERILEPFRVTEGPRPSISIEGETVRLSPKVALTLSLVFNELATNAAKHGALSVAAGRVAVTWRTEAADAAPRFYFKWQETRGPAVAPPTHKGFGSRLIEEALAQDLDGEVHVAYEPAGLVCRLAMPLDAPVAM